MATFSRSDSVVLRGQSAEALAKALMEAQREAEEDPEIAAIAEKLQNLDLSRVNTMEPLFNTLTENYDVSVGKAASRKEREDKSLTATTLVYGEIRFEPFGIAIEKVKSVYGSFPESGGIFYDMGCGTGKPCFAAAMIHPFEKVIGIELLEGLYRIASDIKAKWDSEIKLTLEGDFQRTEIEFRNEDFTNVDLSDADLVFANSTCYDEALMSKLADLCHRVRSGVCVITMTKRLPSPDFSVLESERYQMSWGEATVFIQRKR